MFEKIIFVHSNKGGVGKTTTSGNLAREFGNVQDVAVLDADVFGPSIPVIFPKSDCVCSHSCIHSKSSHFNSNWLDGSNVKPIIYNTGTNVLEIMSYGYISNILSGSSQPKFSLDVAADIVIMMLFQTSWSANTLIIDLPPGTGDILIRLFDRIYKDARFTKCAMLLVVVTTCDEVAIRDTEIGLTWIQKHNSINLAVAGVVLNMAYSFCGKCNEIQENIFLSSMSIDDTIQRFVHEFTWNLPMPKIARSDNQIYPWPYGHVTISPTNDMRYAPVIVCPMSGKSHKNPLYMMRSIVDFASESASFDRTEPGVYRKYFAQDWNNFVDCLRV